MKLTLDDIKNNRHSSVLLYRAVRGSHAFGLATETSDVDEVWVYMCPLETIHDLGEDYQPTIENETHDIVVYEITRFLEFMADSNPNTLEAIFIPDNYVLYVHPIFQGVIDMRNNFLSKKSFRKYTGYAREQIKKARGLNKMIVKKPLTHRDTMLDYCYVNYNLGSTKIQNWLTYRHLDQKFCGAVNIPNMVCSFGACYDWGQSFNAQGITWEKLLSLYNTERKESTADIVKFKKEHEDELDESSRQLIEDKLDLSHLLNMVEFIVNMYHIHSDIDLQEWYEKHSTPIGYRGLIDIDKDSNELRLSPIPKGDMFIVTGTYNKDAYSSHCKEYKRQQEWLENRNEERFRTNTEHGKNYDSKNMYSCCRILLTACEFAETGVFRLYRPEDREFLLSIKKGEKSYDDIMAIADSLQDRLNEAVKTTTVPDEVDVDAINDYLIYIRGLQCTEEGREYINKGIHEQKEFVKIITTLK